MANINAVFGLRPAKTLGAGYNTSGFSTYKMATGAGDNIFTGSLVMLQANGMITIAVDNTTANILGVCGGFYYDNAQGEPTFGPYWPASTETYNEADVEVKVYDDPNTLFEVQSVAGTTGQAVIGANANSSGNANGSTTSGLSSCYIDAPNAAATAEQLRIVDVTSDVDNKDLSSNNVNLVVRINEHAYTTLTGI
jgi:hypothetical protein